MKLSKEKFFKSLQFDDQTTYYCESVECESCPISKECTDRPFGSSINKSVLHEYKKYQSERIKLWKSIK